MKIALFILITLLSLGANLVLAEALFPGHLDFVARGCVLGKSTKMIIAKIPECDDKPLCNNQGAVSCYFLNSKLIQTGTDWKKIADVNVTPMEASDGTMNWIFGVSGLLCPPKNGSCDNLDLDQCANLSAKEMGCSLKKWNPRFQTIPRNKKTTEGVR